MFVFMLTWSVQTTYHDKQGDNEGLWLTATSVQTDKSRLVFKYLLISL